MNDTDLLALFGAASGIIGPIFALLILLLL